MEIGTTVTARRWVSGRQAEPRKGVVVDYVASDVVVWFYTLGGPVLGDTVQALNRRTLAVVGGLGDLSERQLRGWERLAVREDNHLRRLAHRVRAELTRRRKAA